MENFFSFFFFFLVNYYHYFLLTIFFILLSNFLIFKKTKNSPPTPLALPIFGHLHLINKPLPQALKHLSDRYGPILLLRFGSQSILTLTSPSAVEECLTKNDIIFADRPPVLAAKHIGYNYTSIEWSSYGPLWRNQRRLANLKIFSSKSLQASSHIRNEEVRHLISQLFQKSTSSSSSTSTMEMRFEEVDLGRIFFELEFHIIMKMVTGRRYSGDKIWTFDSLIRETFLPERLVFMVDFLPILQWIDYQGTEKMLKRVRRNKDAFLDGLIDEKRKIRKMMSSSTTNIDHAGVDNDHERKKEIMNKSLIDSLLSLQEEEPETYTDELMKGIIGAMFSAGIETSLLTLVASMSLLLKNPEALAKLKTELDLHIEEGRVISESDLPKLPYLRCVVNEALRLHPPAPVPLPHQSSQDCTIGGYDIPRGTMLFLNAWAIHRDPKVWEEPTKFKPERFEGFKDDRMEGFKWIPFGSGRRSCPGSVMALRGASLAVGAMIQCFDWRKVDDELNVDMKEEEEEGAEPSPRAMYRPRMDKKDLLSQI